MLKTPLATLALVALATAPAFAQSNNSASGQSTTNTTNTMNSPSNVKIPSRSPSGKMDDQSAALYVMMDSVGEVQECQLAQQKSQNQAVKSFCSQMISDHTKLAGQAQQMAQQLGAPSTKTKLQASNEAKVELAHLNGYSGHQFDEEFMHAQIDDHRNDIEVLRAAMEGSTNAQAKSFDQQTLTQLTNHLKMANDTLNQVEAQGKNGG